MPEIIRVQHPLVQDKLTELRDKHTTCGMFRALISDISFLLGYEAMRSFPTQQRQTETPLNVTVNSPTIAMQDIALVAVLRAGLGMLDGMLRLVPEAHVGHIGVYRDPKTTNTIEYYFKMPTYMPHKHVFVVDPLIATGHSAVAALNHLKETKPKSITYICVLASKAGIKYVQEHHNDLVLYTAAIDDNLDSKNYIIPGVGDAGDRMYGTV